MNARAGRTVLFGCLAASLALLGCDRQPGTAPSTQAPAKAAPEAAGTGKWPFLNPSESSATLAGGVDPAMSLKRNYYLVFDASGSMAFSECSGRESKIEVAKRALVEFADKLPAGVNLGLSVFDDRGVRELLALGPLRRGAVASAIAAITAGGDTPLAESIQQAYDALTAQGRKQLGYGEFHLVVVTDGEASTADPRTVVNAMLAKSPVVLHTIGFCIGSDHSLNQPGRVIYRAADNPAELASGLADVLAESPRFDAKSFK